MKKIYILLMLTICSISFASQQDIIIKLQDKNNSYRNESLDGLICVKKNRCITFFSEGRKVIKETGLLSKVKDLVPDTFSIKSNQLFINYQNTSTLIGHLKKSNNLTYKLTPLPNIAITSKIQKRQITVGADGDEYIIYPTFDRVKVFNIKIKINNKIVFNVLGKAQTSVFNTGHAKAAGYTFMTTKNGIKEDDTNANISKACMLDSEWSSSYFLGHTKLMRLLQRSYLSLAQQNEIAKIIKNGNVDLNAKTKDVCGYRPVLAGSHVGQTALMLATERANSYIVKLLLDNGANPNLTDEYKRNALFYIKGSYPPEKKNEAIKIINYLLDSNIDASNEAVNISEYKSKFMSTHPINTFNKNITLTPIMHFTRYFDSTPEFNPHLSQAIELLIHNGADINQQTKLGYTALHLAAATYKTLNHVKYIMDLGANKNIKDSQGRRPIDWVGKKDVWTTEDEFRQVLDLLR